MSLMTKIGKVVAIGIVGLILYSAPLVTLTLLLGAWWPHLNLWLEDERFFWVPKVGIYFENKPVQPVDSH
jgi:hypothetical protein